MTAPRCMICGRGTDQVGRLSRVNDFGQTGVWSCDEHAHQALKTFADAKGFDAVRPDLRKHVDPALQFKRWDKRT
jgi:hypothetical protein